MPAINLTARLNRDQTFETLALTPSAKCLYLTSEDHADEFVMTAQDADPRQDRITLSGNRFRHIDMVLIDDFQYFAGRTALQGATAADAESIASGGAMTQPAIRSEPFSLGDARALRPAKRTRNPSEARNSGPYRNVHLCGYVRNPHTFPNENGSLRGRCRQIAPYSRSSMPMSVLPSFLRTFFTTARSTTLSFISVTGEPSRSLTVALSRLRTS